MEASRAQLDRHERRLAEHHGSLTALDDRLERVEARVHHLERDRQLVHDLAQTTRDLAQRTKDLAGGIEAIAERAVEKVLERRSMNRRQVWTYRMGWLAGLVAVAAFFLDHWHAL